MDVLERIAELQKIIEERTGLSRICVTINIHHNTYGDGKIGKMRAKSVMKKLLGEEAQSLVKAVVSSRDKSAKWVTYADSKNKVDITVFHA